jgi:sucrose phosphorylase
MIVSTKPIQQFIWKIAPLLEKVYGKEVTIELIDKLIVLLELDRKLSPATNLDKWSEDDILLIVYGNSFRSQDGEPPLVTLDRFLTNYLQDTITGVHILPFFPYSSDDGFSVIDYLQVNPELGDWQDIARIASKFKLAIDLVINHISSKSQWFEQFLAGEKPGCDYFIEVDPQTDLSLVVRPRSSPVLTEVDTVRGKKYVWTTFSDDQIDLNFSNPDVLLEIVKIALFYARQGAKYIRLDAVGYLWKKIGSSCIHLTETHALVRAIREIFQEVAPDVAIITETNVPNRENLSYFGNRDEAHIIYNFSLPPLLLNALIQGKSEHLKTWMMSMPPAPMGCTYLNFMASHDGIGVRPAEGLLGETEYQQLLATMKRFGGRISMRKHQDGTESPYEINISLFDALKGTVKGEDRWQIERFICSQTILLAIEGIPAFYIHSMLATPNDYDLLSKTGRNRSINRHQWDWERLERLLKDPHSPQSKIFYELRRRIEIRRRQPAFHPYATQYTLHPMNKSIFAFWRQSRDRDRSIFCIYNLSDRTQKLPLSNLNLTCTDLWYDLIGERAIDNIYDKLQLEPYQAAWISNRTDG